MYDRLVKSMRLCGDSVDAIDECCYAECIQHETPVDPLCMQALCNKAADAIEERDKYALTLQHEMMAEAESHIALVERLNRKIEELSKRVPPVPHGRLIDADALLDDLLFPSKQFEQGMRELIGDAPTVIPAEEGE